MTSQILIIGATGTVGRHLTEQLVRAGHSVKAASRSGNAVAEAEGVAFNFGNRALIDAALKGVDSAYLLSPAGTLDAASLLSPFIEAAAATNVKIVLQTAMGVDADDAIPLRQAELKLERSGSPFVILRPNWFSDNFHSYWYRGVKQGLIQLPAEDAKTSFIDARDIAASAAGALTTSHFDGQAFTLTGAEALSYGQAAEILSNVAGRTIAFRSIDDDAFVAQAVEAGLPQDYARMLAGIFYVVRQGWASATTDAVEVLSGQPPRALEIYARDYADRFKT